MNRICLFGASGHGKVVKEIVESQGNKVIAFLDDNPKTQELLHLPVFKTTKKNDFLLEKWIVTIGDNTIRKKVTQNIAVVFDKAIHTTAVISSSSTIDNGTVVMAGAIINAEASIGKHCIINTNAVVEHDCVINDYVHVSPNATVTGGVEIGEGTHVGAGAIVIPNLKIGKWVTIGAGTVILKDIPDYAVVVGNPGRIIKYKENTNE